MRWAFCASVLLSTLQASALAQSATNARTLFEQGNAALKERDYTTAIEKLTESLRLEPRPATAYNLAIAYQDAARPLEAEALLDQLLDAEFGALANAQSKAVHKLRTKVGRRVGVLLIRVQGPDRYELEVDGRLTDYDLDDGAARVRLNPGRHRVELRATMFAAKAQTVELNAGQVRRFAIRLKPLGELWVESAEATSRVEVEGLGASDTPFRKELTPGTYRVRRAGTSQWREVEVKPGSVHRVTLDEDAGSIIESPWFWLASAAALGIGVGAVVLVGSSGGSNDEIRDPIYGTVETLVSW